MNVISTMRVYEQCILPIDMLCGMSGWRLAISFRSITCGVFGIQTLLVEIKRVKSLDIMKRRMLWMLVILLSY